MSIRLYGSGFSFGSADDPRTGYARTDEAVALAYATSLPTLEYFDIEGHQCAIRTRFWRVIREESEGNSTISVGLRELDEEDGANAKDWFDWKV